MELRLATMSSMTRRSGCEVATNSDRTAGNSDRTAGPGHITRLHGTAAEWFHSRLTAQS